MSRLRTLLAAAVLLLLPFHLLAATVAAPSAFDKFMALATGAGKTTVTLASNGTPLAAPGVPTIETDGGLPKATATGSVVNPAGNRVPVSAVARVPAAEIGAATGRMLVRLGLKAAAVIGAGVVLYDFAKEIKFILSRNPDGSIKVEKEDPDVCTVAPCYSYTMSGATFPTALKACQRQAELGKAANPQFNFVNPRTNSDISNMVCYIDIYYTNGTPYILGAVVGISVTPIPARPVAYLPSNQQEFIDAVAAKSGWPTSSKVGQLLEESAAETGVKVKTGPMTVTGPATSPGAQKVTQNTTNNTTKTENTTYNHTYNGDTINTTTVTITNITNTTTGEPISSETTTETPDKEEDPPKVDVTDTPLPAQPKLYTPKYPNGLEGVWTQQKAALNATPLATLAGKLMPRVGNSGTCPVMNIDLSLAVWADFGVRDVAPPCYVWDWARLIVLVGALLLARALIFGG